MKIGTVAVLKKNKKIMVEVKAISEEDVVTVALCDGGAVFKISLNELLDVGAVQCHREPFREVDILGITYSILIVPYSDYRADREADGWIDTSVKEILIYNYEQDVVSVKDLETYQRKVLRHEIIHAFLFESGLWQDSLASKSWAKNEEMVDWLAIQFPKIQKVFKEANCEE